MLPGKALRPAARISMLKARIHAGNEQPVSAGDNPRARHVSP